MDIQTQGILILITAWCIINVLSEGKSLGLALVAIPVAICFYGAIGYGLHLFIGITIAEGMAYWFAFVVVKKSIVSSIKMIRG
jgi:hypothetical protein